MGDLYEIEKNIESFVQQPFWEMKDLLLNASENTPRHLKGVLIDDNTYEELLYIITHSLKFLPTNISHEMWNLMGKESTVRMNGTMKIGEEYDIHRRK
jgi:hypothetical protein